MSMGTTVGETEKDEVVETVVVACGWPAGSEWGRDVGEEENVEEVLEDGAAVEVPPAPPTLVLRRPRSAGDDSPAMVTDKEEPRGSVPPPPAAGFVWMPLPLVHPIIARRNPALTLVVGSSLDGILTDGAVG